MTNISSFPFVCKSLFFLSLGRKAKGLLADVFGKKFNPVQNYKILQSTKSTVDLLAENE